MPLQFYNHAVQRVPFITKRRKQSIFLLENSSAFSNLEKIRIRLSFLHESSDNLIFCVRQSEMLLFCITILCFHIVLGPFLSENQLEWIQFHFRFSLKHVEIIEHMFYKINSGFSL